MTNDNSSQQSESRQTLADYREAIEHFPFRQQIALLHEFEQAEARQSDIESRSARSRVALSDHVNRTLLSGVPQETIIDLRQGIQSLKSNMQQMKKQVDESRRHLA